MQTEDDTFAKLKRISFDEMSTLVWNIPTEAWCRMDDNECREFFKSHGWTYKEWLRYAK